MPRRNAEPWVTWPGGFPSRVGRTEKRSFRRMPCPPWRWKESVLPSKVRRPMSSSSRRFEILLPLRFNDRRLVVDVPVRRGREISVGEKVSGRGETIPQPIEGRSMTCGLPLLDGGGAGSAAEEGRRL